jgi:hypothetical protein
MTSTPPWAVWGRRLACGVLLLLASSRVSPGTEFDRIVIDDKFPGGYQVEVADVNGDGRPDVIGIGGGTCAWFENPTWKKRVVTTPKQTPGIISSATADLDGDGKAEIAIGYEFAMSEPTKGKLLLAVQGKGLDDPWSLTTVVDASRPLFGSVRIDGTRIEPPPLPLAAVGSIHRLRWGWIIGTIRVGSGKVSETVSISVEKKLELVVAPIFGPSAKAPTFDQEPAHVILFDTGSEPKSGRWTPRIIGQAPVLHAIDIVNLYRDDNGPSAVLTASNLGVTAIHWNAIGGAALFQSDSLAAGAPGNAPKKGSSEVHVGRLKDGRRFLATIEPWHGTEVAVYLSESLKPLKFGARTVIDTTLKDGHALWVADVDGDGDDEIFAGYRGKGTSVLGFDFNGKTWDRAVIDAAIAAQDLRGGDIDGDGTPDVVAIGGSTHNVVWYRPRKAK